MNRIHEEIKIDFPLPPQALNNSNATGRYFKLDKFREACFVLSVKSMAATKTAKIEVYEASDLDGTDAALVTDGDATITANTLVTEATVTCASVISTDVLVVNGVSLTVVASGGNADDLSVTVGGTDTAMAAAFAAAINNSDYGIDGVTASSSSGVLTIKSTTGEQAVTVSTPDATMTLATVSAFAYVDLKGADLSIDDDLIFVAPKITVTSNSTVSVALLRGAGSGSFTQGAGASAVL